MGFHGTWENQPKVLLKFGARGFCSDRGFDNFWRIGGNFIAHRVSVESSSVNIPEGPQFYYL